MNIELGGEEVFTTIVGTMQQPEQLNKEAGSLDLHLFLELEVPRKSREEE